MEAPGSLQAAGPLHFSSSPPVLHVRSGGNPGYIIAVFVVFACLLGLVAAVVRNSVCKGTAEAGANGRPYLRGILFESAVMSPGMLQAVAYRASVESAGSTPRRGLLNDVPSSPGLEPGVVKRLPMVCYKASKHRWQGSGLRECSGRAGGGDGAKMDSGRGDGSEACSVCLSSFKEGDFLRVLPDCSHLFHVDCVDTWLLTRSSCPLCRSEVTGKTPNCSTKLGKLLARFGNGRSFRCSRSFSGQELGSFRSRLGSDHGSFRSRLGTDQEAGGIGSNRFYETEVGQSETEQPGATVIQVEDQSRHPTVAADSTSEKSVADRSTDIQMSDLNPPAPITVPLVIVVRSAHVRTDMVTPSDTPRLGISEPVSPGRLDLPSFTEQ